MKIKYQFFLGGRVRRSLYRDHQVSSKQNIFWTRVGLDMSLKEHSGPLDQQITL